MQDAGVGPSQKLSADTPDELMKRFGSLPLIHQPGEQWLYHSGSDILGVLIARASDKSLGTFLHERILAPLGMNDTGFSVPEAKLGRLATCYRTDPKTREPHGFRRGSRKPVRQASGFRVRRRRSGLDGG